MPSTDEVLPSKIDRYAGLLDITPWRTYCHMQCRVRGVYLVWPCGFVAPLPAGLPIGREGAARFTKLSIRLLDMVSPSGVVVSSFTSNGPVYSGVPISFVLHFFSAHNTKAPPFILLSFFLFFYFLSALQTGLPMSSPHCIPPSSHIEAICLITQFLVNPT